MKASDPSVDVMDVERIGAILLIVIVGVIILFAVIKTITHHNDEPIILEARRSIEIIHAFDYPSSKALNKKLKDVAGIATDVSNALISEKKLFDNKSIKKLNALSETHLSKIAALIQTYSRVQRGQLDINDYPGIEANLEALLDAAKADLILESKSLFKSIK